MGCWAGGKLEIPIPTHRETLPLEKHLNHHEHQLHTLLSTQLPGRDPNVHQPTGLERFGNKLVDLNLVPRKELDEEVLVVFKPKYLFFVPALALPGPLWDAAGPISCPAKPNPRAVEGEKGRTSTFFLLLCFSPPVLEDKIL